MKNLISKFKSGHTNEETDALLLQPIILRTETNCNMWQLKEISDDEEAQHLFLTKMLVQLSEELLERNLVQVVCTDDIQSGIRTYRAELAVISPDDLRNAR